MNLRLKLTSGSNETVELGFHTVRGCVDPGNRPFRPRFVRVVHVRT